MRTGLAIAIGALPVAMILVAPVFAARRMIRTAVAIGAGGVALAAVLWVGVAVMGG